MPGGLEDSQLAMNLLQRGDDLLAVPAPSDDDLDDADTAALPRPSTSSLERGFCESTQPAPRQELHRLHGGRREGVDGV